MAPSPPLHSPSASGTQRPPDVPGGGQRHRSKGTWVPESPMGDGCPPSRRNTGIELAEAQTDQCGSQATVRSGGFVRSRLL